ncbi:hypothetical protein FPOA_13140 [Fusarium poae]|uniref:Uncharacterized protein n=1 Tax=Fusarium poae TaxID=36050 RepID=A0A1B8A6S9_FUSPO|nr:hypothetical protein FPOA_13140 [Fusarium poae]
MRDTTWQTRVSERQTTDAEYFYNITLLWLKNGGPEQGHRPNPWFAQLIRHSEGKAKALKRLWSGPSSQGDVLRRFHEIPALFWGISLGNIGKIIAMPRQQTRNQIRRVFDFWDYICCHDVSMKLRLDMNTVKAVSGRGSGAYADLNLANIGEVLRNFDAPERAAILSRLESARRTELFQHEPRGIDVLLQRASEVGEYDLVDDEYRPQTHGASEQLVRQEEQLRASISELQERYDQLLSLESQCQRRRIDDKKQEENKLDESIRTLKAQGQILENRKTQLQTEVNQVEAAKRDLDTEYQTLCQKISDERQSLSALNSKKETASDDLKRLEHQKKNVEQVIDTLESRRKELESEAQGVRNQEEEADLFPFAGDSPPPMSETADLREIEEDNPPLTPETSDLQRMAFPVEVIEQQGYSIADKDMRTLTSYTCFRALEIEEKEENRLIILIKENLVYSEHDILGDIYSMRPRKRAREGFLHHAPQIKRNRVAATDDADGTL